VAEDVCDLGFAEAGGVVFERDVELGVVDLEAAEAVGVGEFAEALKLFVAERRMKLVGDFEKCHEGIIPVAAGNGAGTRSLQPSEKHPLAGIPHPRLCGLGIHFFRHAGNRALDMK